MADEIATGLAQSIVKNTEVTSFEGMVNIKINVNQIASDLHGAMDDHIRCRLEKLKAEKQ